MFPRLLVLVLLAVSADSAQDLVYFEREWPGAAPGQIQVELKRDGSALYSEDGETPGRAQVGRGCGEGGF